MKSDLDTRAHMALDYMINVASIYANKCGGNDVSDHEYFSEYVKDLSIYINYLEVENAIMRRRKYEGSE